MSHWPAPSQGPRNDREWNEQQKGKRFVIQHIYKKPFYQHSKEESFMSRESQYQGAAAVKGNLNINLNQARPTNTTSRPLCPFPLCVSKTSTAPLLSVTLGEACGATLAEDAGVKCGVSFVSWATGLSAFNSLFSLLVHTDNSYMLHQSQHG